MASSSQNCPRCPDRPQLVLITQPEEHLYCPTCGRKFERRQAAPVEEQAPVAAYDPAMDYEWLEMQRRQRRKMLTVVGGLVGAGVLVLLLIIVANSGGENQPQEPERQGAQARFPEGARPKGPRAVFPGTNPGTGRKTDGEEEVDNPRIRRTIDPDAPPTPTLPNGKPDPLREPPATLPFDALDRIDQKDFPKPAKGTNPWQDRAVEPFTPFVPEVKPRAGIGDIIDPLPIPGGPMGQSLGKKTDLDDLSIQPPAGYLFQDLTGNGTTKSYLWSGRRLAVGSEPLLGISVTPGAKNAPAHLLFQRMMGGISRRWEDFEQDAVDQGKLNGIPFLHTRWHGRTKDFHAMGEAFLTVQGDKAIFLFSQDSEPFMGGALEMHRKAFETITLQ